MIIRLARPDDADALVAILHDSFDSTWRPAISDEAARAFVAERRPAGYVARHGRDFRVAERHGVVAGFIHWSDDFVNALHIHRRHARTGVGTRLMDHAEAAIAHGFGAARLETDTFNTASQAFYAARGYREAGRYPDHEWNSGLTTLLLVKKLG